MAKKAGKAKPRGQRAANDLATSKRHDVKGGTSKFVAKPPQGGRVIQDGKLTEGEYAAA